jgi:cell division protein FtsB
MSEQELKPPKPWYVQGKTSEVAPNEIIWLVRDEEDFSFACLQSRARAELVADAWKLPQMRDELDQLRAEIAELRSDLSHARSTCGIAIVERESHALDAKNSRYFLEQEEAENRTLRAENEKLREEIKSLKNEV